MSSCGLFPIRVTYMSELTQFRYILECIFPPKIYIGWKIEEGVCEERKKKNKKKILCGKKKCDDR